MRVIAFYLPQYHPIRENDEWWGAGFTEWTNVAKARPLFAGHHQPHIPADLGFYDLRLAETREAQARLAAAYGITGFCYYHYWFNERQLLERPFDEVRQSGAPDFPFCLCWANENWTRRWDGLEREVLVAQDYARYDAAAHLRWLAPAFADPRYIRVDGRPLFLIYRASDIPNLAEVIDTWHRTADEIGVPRPFVCAASNAWTRHQHDELIALGADAVYEFEPNNRDIPVQRSMPQWPQLHVYDYRAIRDAAMTRPSAEATVFPCVFPSWDNTARRGPSATVIQNDDPELYGEWLRHAVKRAEPYEDDRQIVFINAWNEWAEGCHLEPDRRLGHAFLRATARALGHPAPSIVQSDATVADATGQDVDVRVSAARPLFIWGTGTVGRRVRQALADADVPVAGFLDNNPASWGTSIGETLVAPPAEILAEPAHEARAPFVLVASMYADDIAAQLETAGRNRMRDFLTRPEGLIVSKAEGSVRFRSGLTPTCNVCGGTSFRRTDVDSSRQAEAACGRCGASTGDRLLAYLLSEEVMLHGRPVMDWPTQRRVVATLDGLEGPLSALERSVSYHKWQTPAPDAALWDIVVGTLAHSPMAEEVYWERVMHSVNVGGAVLLATDLPALNGSKIPSDAARLAAARLGLRVQSLNRSYPAHAIADVGALILRKERS